MFNNVAVNLELTKKTTQKHFQVLYMAVDHMKSNSHSVMKV